MLIELARMGLILGTMFYVLWLISELMHRREIAKVILRGSGGDGDITDFKFGWKLSLGFLLGVPALGILWGLVI